MRGKARNLSRKEIKLTRERGRRGTEGKGRADMNDKQERAGRKGHEGNERVSEETNLRE